ncbi:MAG TPA: hypothetical protein VJ761_21855 [Ktedonobacteraceae bacterium]|nr:hypothetical protein [Ktedonobacteraceae bacterium]
MRDDFSKKTKDILFKRARARCSNPECGKETSGAHSEEDRAVNIGEAAHITAASPDGARYDPTLSAEERKSPKNGIWLCASCATLVDSDSPKYTVELLRTWKTLAEAGDRREAARKERVRRILSWEHTYNIDILEKFWKQVNLEAPPKDQLDPTKEFERNLRFTEVNLDGWAHQMWQSYLGEIASALHEDEFNQSIRLHSTLDTFSSRRKSFAAILHGDDGRAGIEAYYQQKQLQRKSPGAYIPNNMVAIYNTNEFVRPLWDECDRLYTICHEIGNPIRV